jgi:hypothetical protein
MADLVNKCWKLECSSSKAADEGKNIGWTVSSIGGWLIQIQASDVIDPFQKCFLYDFVIALQPFYPFPGYLFPTS